MNGELKANPYTTPMERNEMLIFFEKTQENVMKSGVETLRHVDVVDYT
jgi:hypothetical protein